MIPRFRIDAGRSFEKDRLPSFEGRAGEGCQAASSTHNAKIADWDCQLIPNLSESGTLNIDSWTYKQKPSSRNESRKKGLNIKKSYKYDS